MPVSVVIGLDSSTMSELQVARQPIQPPVLARGLIDTATNVTAVSSQILHQLGTLPVGRGSTQTAGGGVEVRVFKVSFSIIDPTTSPGSIVVRPELVVQELTTPLPDADVLIGMDLLLECLLVLNGPSGLFTVAC